MLRHEEKAFSGFIEARERPEGKATEGESKNTKTTQNPENEQKQEDRTRENGTRGRQRRVEGKNISRGNLRACTGWAKPTKKTRKYSCIDLNLFY